MPEGNHMQDGFFAVDYQGMASVMPTLKTHNGVHLIG
jgi:hypothetical protein